ncbi:hypothetical protein GALL_529400 [mine drainage metagenome]|uniref:Uncharacterized protein n=1 Tax=mine drainage metagenome TaxID=410659 RepID=A0A1J5PDA9_9ZZZZ
MRLLNRLRQDVSQREFEVWAVIFEAAILEHRHHAADAVFPDRLFVFHHPAERAKFGDRGAFAHAEFDAPVADEIEAGDFFGHAGRMVGGQLDDAVTQPDLLGALAGRGEEHLGLRRVRVFLQEVVLDLPRVVVAQLVGQFDLRQRVLVQLVFGVRFPGTGALQLVKDAEFHWSLSRYFFY